MLETFEILVRDRIGDLITCADRLNSLDKVGINLFRSNSKNYVIFGKL